MRSVRGRGLAGRAVLITGGARGIGGATAAASIRAGARVALIDRDSDAVTATARELGPAAFAFCADVTDPEALSRVVDDAARALGGIDVAIANAGVAPKMATVAGTSLSELERVLAINVRGAWNTTQAALPYVRERHGRIVLIASVYSFINGMFCGPYAISKAGVEALGRTLRVELAGEGVGVTVAHFGFVDTDLVSGSLDGDSLASRLEALWPAAITRRLSAEQAADALLRAITRGKPRVIAPPMWRVLDTLRGPFASLLDGATARDPRLRAIVADARERELVDAGAARDDDRSMVMRER